MCLQECPVSLIKLPSTNTFMGSPETFPGRDIRADTKGGSITPRYPMWKRLQEIIPETLSQWSGKTNRDIQACTIFESATLTPCFICFTMWLVLLQLFCMISYGRPASAFSCDFYLIAKSTYDHDALSLSIFSWSLLPFGLLGLRFSFPYSSPGCTLITCILIILWFEWFSCLTFSQLPISMGSCYKGLPLSHYNSV